MLRSTALFLLSAVALLSQSAAPPYTWSATGPLMEARHDACAAALPDSRILVAGGEGVAGPLRTVEIYQADGTFAPANSMLRARTGHTCTTLDDGRVLATGGMSDASGPQAEIFDPALNTWTAVENGAARWNQTATLLPDGRVLLAGGETELGPTDLLEWFNPRSNRIRELPVRLAAARTWHAASALPDGSVLVSGGWDGNGFLDSAEIVTIDGGVKSAAALPSARALHTATALDNGCILIAGGLGVDGEVKSASLYCPNTGTFGPAGDLAVPRYGHLALRLPNNNKVLISGGFSQGEPTAASEIYDPDAHRFTRAGDLTRARLGIAGAADPTTGAVLAVGGYTADGPIAGCGILRAPSAAFDKARYVDGDVVTVTGLGWTPSEKVNLVLTNLSFAKSGQLQQISFQNFQTTANALGRISQTLFTASPQSAGFTYKMTATGATSGLTASSSARQVSRTTVTLNVSPLLALTRQPITLQAILQPVTALDPLDGNVDFRLLSGLLGSVSSNGPILTNTATGGIADGTSNTIQIGETLTSSTTGFSRTFTAPDGSVRFLGVGGVFQLVTRDIPAGGNLLTVNNPSAVTASYAPFTSLYAPNSATTSVNVRKRIVNVTLQPLVKGFVPRVGDPLTFLINLNAPETPAADVPPSGNVHLTVAPGNVIDAPLSPVVFGPAAQAVVTTTLPAGTRSFSAQYDGDSVFLPGSVTNAGTLTVDKGFVNFSVAPGKPIYTVGEPITLTAKILHPRVVGATPTGNITGSGASFVQSAALGPDPQNSGEIDVNLPISGTPNAGTYTVNLQYSGDSNFNPAFAGTLLTIVKAVPQLTVIPPTQVVAGQAATFTVRMAAPAGFAVNPVISGTVTVTGIPNGASAGVVSASSGASATIHQVFASAGTFIVQVQYSGNTNYQSVLSQPITVVVQ